MDEPKWLLWARELQAIAQTGLAFTEDPYDLERYQRLRAHRGRDVSRMARMRRSSASTRCSSRRSAMRRPRSMCAAPCFAINGFCWCTRSAMAAGRCRGLGRCESIGPGVRRARNPRGIGIRGAGGEARRGIYDYRRQGHRNPLPYSIYKLFFICELTGGEARTSLETSAVEFFALDELPPLSMGRTNPRQIERMFAHRRDAGLADGIRLTACISGSSQYRPRRRPPDAARCPRRSNATVRARRRDPRSVLSSYRPNRHRCSKACRRARRSRADECARRRCRRRRDGGPPGRPPARNHERTSSRCRLGS